MAVAQGGWETITEIIHMKNHLIEPREGITGFITAFSELISVYRTRQLKIWGVQDFIKQFSALQQHAEPDINSLAEKIRMAESFCKGLRKELTEETSLLTTAETHLMKLKEMGQREK